MICETHTQNGAKAIGHTRWRLSHTNCKGISGGTFSVFGLKIIENNN